MKRNYDNIETSSVMPEGTYSIMCTSAAITKTKSTNKPQIELKLKGLNKEGKGATGRMYLQLGQNSLWVVKSVCEAMKKPELVTGDVDDTVTAAGMVGGVFVADVIIIMNNNGKNVNEFRNFAAAPAPKAVEASDSPEPEIEDDLPF